MECSHPIPVKIQKKNGRIVKISAPCGKCEACLVRKKQAWVFRLSQHLLHSDSACFVTLTYQDGCVPFARLVNTPDGPCWRDCSAYHSGSVSCVSKHDVQAFLKRLRKSVYPFRFSYFLCSEYGPQTGRPHYHMILFDFPKSFDVYDYINRAWSKGFISVSDVNSSRISYVAKYCVNPLSSDTLRPRTFLLCSKGIGKSYCDDPANVAYHRAYFKPFIKKGDKFIPLPRYCREKIFTYDELDEISLKNDFENRSKYRKLCQELSSMSVEEFENYCRNEKSKRIDFQNRVRKQSKEGSL